MKSSTSGFSIILAMGLTLLLSLTGLFLMEYMVPFSRSVSGIENSSQAFYQSYGGLEKSILLTYSGGLGYQPGDDILDSASPVDTSYVVISSGSTIPQSGKGSSEFDADYNRLSQNEPVSLLVGDDSVSELNLEIRVPDFNRDANFTNDINISSDDELVLWQLSSSNDSLSAETLLDAVSSVNLFSEDGLSLNATSITDTTSFSSFYASECSSGNQCVLKISLVNPAISPSGGTLPYLEYKIDTNGGVIPFQESYISSSGKSYGFRKDLEIALPHDTTSSAFDFTVLQ